MAKKITNIYQDVSKKELLIFYSRVKSNWLTTLTLTKTCNHIPQLTGELFILRGIIKGDRITILNTDKYDQEHIKLYISFYIKDPELQIKILQ